MVQIRNGLLDFARELELHSKVLTLGCLKVLNSTVIRLYWMNSKVSSVIPWQISSFHCAVGQHVSKMSVQMVSKASITRT